MSRPCPLRHRWRDAFVGATDDPAIDAYALVIGVAVYHHMSHDGTACVGLRRLAALSRTTVPTVRDRLARLEAAGWLVATTVPGARGCYRATFPGGDGGPGGGVRDDPGPEAVQPDAVDNGGEGDEGVQPEPEAVQPDRGGCAAGFGTYTETPRTPTPLPPAGRSRRRRARPSRQPSARSRLAHDPSVGRPPPGRPPVEVSRLEVRDDGTWWVELGAAA